MYTFAAALGGGLSLVNTELSSPDCESDVEDTGAAVGLRAALVVEEAVAGVEVVLGVLLSKRRELSEFFDEYNGRK